MGQSNYHESNTTPGTPHYIKRMTNQDVIEKAKVLYRKKLTSVSYNPNKTIQSEYAQKYQRRPKPE
jgi:hypothetical protein